MSRLPRPAPGDARPARPSAPPGGPRHAPLRARLPTRLAALLSGVVLLGAVGSCELPKPKLPSIGLAPGAAGVAVVAPHLAAVAARGADVATLVVLAGDGGAR